MARFRKLRVSGPARTDLAEIGAHTRREWGVAQQRAYLDQIKDAFKTLQQMPGLGICRDEIATGLRALVVQQHIIFYRETDTELQIVRVLHGRMDVGVLIRGEDDGG